MYAFLLNFLRGRQIGEAFEIVAAKPNVLDFDILTRYVFGGCMRGDRMR